MKRGGQNHRSFVVFLITRGSEHMRCHGRATKPGVTMPTTNRRTALRMGMYVLSLACFAARKQQGQTGGLITPSHAGQIEVSYRACKTRHNPHQTTMNPTPCRHQRVLRAL